MTDLPHTCHAPKGNGCAACDVELIGDRLAGAGSGPSLDALDRIVARLVELTALEDYQLALDERDAALDKRNAEEWEKERDGK